MNVRSVVAAVVLTAAVSSGQDWLNGNYHFPGPPPPGRPTITAPVSDLREIQNTLMAILRKANLAGDYEAALAAAAQAAANAKLLAEQQPTPQAQSTRPKPAIYLIALKDQSIHAATSHWADRTMLHYITLQGAHEQVRLDLVDRNMTGELNRRAEPRPKRASAR